jgi:DNA-binding Lrp family transcriptional regulator
MDQIDLSILNHLQTNARMSNAELARAVNLSPPAVHARVKRLEDEAVIKGYAALLDQQKVGFDLVSFIEIGLAGHQPEQVQIVRDEMHKLPEVLECHHVTGNFDFMLKVLTQNRQGLHEFIVDRLVTIPGVSRVNTSVVLKEVKSTTRLPIQP